jgi:predicted nucleic acid-binding protein
MISAVDTNVILDVSGDGKFAEASQELLSVAYDLGSLIICEIVYSELVPNFRSRNALEEHLELGNIGLVGCGAEVAWLAGQRWADYRAAGGSRERVLPDFIIGAHAVLRADCLLTRDRGFFTTYFPELRLVDRAEQIG